LFFSFFVGSGFLLWWKLCHWKTKKQEKKKLVGHFFFPNKSRDKHGE